MVVAQSGGPSPVINNCLRGIIETARELSEIGTVYGARHGIEGVLKEELLDLSAQPPDEVAPAAVHAGRRLDRHLPLQAQAGADRGFRPRDRRAARPTTSAISCTSAATIRWTRPTRSPQLAGERGLDLVAVGVPKTIDNDVGDSEFKLIDHTPGYGCTAKYWMHMVQNANEENAGSSPADPVLVMQAMGRKIGYIPAAARLADPRREMPLQIYLAESPCSLAQLADKVNDQLKKSGRCLVVISEGFDVGDLGEVKDSFGHVSFSSSQIDSGADRGESLEQSRSGRQRRGAGQRAGHRSAACDGLRLDCRFGRGLSQRPNGGAVGRPRFVEGGLCFF